jgi:hypothetical protein
MTATIPGSPRAVEVSVGVVRAFVRLRELAVTHSDLAKRLSELEEKTERLAMQHDTFSRNTRTQLKQVFDSLRELMTPPQPPEPPKRSIGFLLPGDSGKTDSASGWASGDAGLDSKEQGANLRPGPHDPWPS